MTKSILIVEDDKEMAELTSMLFESEGYRCAICSDGDKAIEMVQALNPELVLLDLMLPGKSGLQICKEIRAFYTGAVLVLTGQDNDEQACLIINGESAEMNGVIGSNIVKTVNQLLSEHPQVNTIILNQVPGSMDDISNLEAARLIYDSGLNTALRSNSDIASGGVDFFLAGVKRQVAAGAKLGVHAWGYQDSEGNYKSA